jgi:integrase
MYWNSRMSREIARYLRKLVEEGYTERYIAQHRHTLSYFQGHCRGLEIKTVNSVSSEAALSFLKKYESYSASYQAKHWVVLRRFLAEYENPALMKVRSKIHGTARTRVDWLTMEECQAILQEPMTPRESLMIGAGLLQGLRRIETLRITVKDARDALRTNILRVRGKGGKERAIPLQDDFSVILRSYVTWLDPEKEDVPILRIGRSYSETLLQAFCKRHGRKFTFHTLRRSFGRNLWLLGVPIETISELLGHASIDMTRKYLGIDQSDMRQALARYRIARACTTSEKPER